MGNDLHDVISKCDDEHQLSGQIEINDRFFTTEIPELQKNKHLKRGGETKAGFGNQENHVNKGSDNYKGAIDC